MFKLAAIHSAGSALAHLPRRGCVQEFYECEFAVKNKILIAVLLQDIASLILAMRFYKY